MARNTRSSSSSRNSSSSSRGSSSSTRGSSPGSSRRFRRIRSMGPVTMTLATTAVLGTIGGLIWMMLRPKDAYAPTTYSDFLPNDPAHDRFGNTGEENMVEPLTLREDEENMSDRLNPHPGLL